MRFTSSLALLASITLGARADDEKVHGQSAAGTTMGPVAFLWPEDRPWSASTDNSGPCGSASGVTNRTEFPLSQGSVALSIADDAWNVAFYLSFDDEPTAKSDFREQVVSNISEIEPGHQCYKIDTLPRTIEAGSNGTIQLEYWSSAEDENGGRNQTFYSCADVTFVDAVDFTAQVPCFNVTAAEFNSGDATPEESSTGLSKGAIAGISVGVVVGSLAIVGAFAFMLLKKRRSNAASVPSHQPQMAKVGDADAASVSTTR